MGGKGGCSDTPKAKNGGSNGKTTDLNSALAKSSTMDLNSSGNVSEDDSVISVPEKSSTVDINSSANVSEDDSLPGKPSTIDLNSSDNDSEDDSGRSPVRMVSDSDSDTKGHVEKIPASKNGRKEKGRKSDKVDQNSSANVSEDDSVKGKPSTVDLNSSGDESIVRQYDSDDDSIRSPGLKSPKVSSKNVPSEHSGNSSEEEELVRPPAKKQRDSSDDELSVKPPAKKRRMVRMVSDSESNSEGHVEKAPASKNGHDSDGSQSDKDSQLKDDITKRKKKLKTKKRVKAYDVAEMSSDEEDEYTDNKKVYESDEDSEAEEEVIDEDNLSKNRKDVITFFNEATELELQAIKGGGGVKAKNIMAMRPYNKGWKDLVKKIRGGKKLNTDLLNSASMLIKMRDAVSRLMVKCEKITKKMNKMVEDLTKTDGATMELTEQPKCIPDDLKIHDYQLIGLNWLALMHKQSLNGILADEMGLGKTIQAISFLAHLKEIGEEGPHLIIVPASTMDNWQKELDMWCPNLEVLNYYGAMDERRHMQQEIINKRIEFDVILTTYSMVVNDSKLFRKIDVHYVIFDEAHMLKNMATSRYENLMRIKASRKLLLTGTPMQNNLVELMSLLVFVMPNLFANKKEDLKKIFAMFPKSQGSDVRSGHEQKIILHAKQIMKPFFLRRLKSEVLKNLPEKTEEIIQVPMIKSQHESYSNMKQEYKNRAKDIADGKVVAKNDFGMSMIMNLRKLAIHPLLIRNHFDTSQVRQMAQILKKDQSHENAEEKFIVEDLSVMSDFDIHSTCLAYRCIRHLQLSNHQLCDSGKFKLLDEMLPKMKVNGDKVLIFTQFVMVLDIMDKYLKIRGYKYLRLDGTTPVQERQTMIDAFNNDESYFIFILSTRAGGLGINLTSANTVILHDLDFNPYNDKQAEDRCHRLGQTRPVRVIRLISQETIEEGLYSIAQDKLKLEQDLVNSDEDPDKASGAKTVKTDISRLLKAALGVDMSNTKLGDIETVFEEKNTNKSDKRKLEKKLTAGK